MTSRFALLLAAVAAVTSTHAARAVPAEPVDLDAGPSHTCTVTSCGDVLCFGSNTYGQAASRRVPVIYNPWNPPRYYRAVSVGRRHTCALDTTGRIACWGSNGSGQLAVPATQGPFAALDAGDFHTCAVTTTGSAVCWGGAVGATTPSALTPPAGVTFTTISAGANHTCGTTPEGGVRCWGSDTYRQSRSGSEPLPAALNERFTDVSAGTYHTCATSNFGYAYCWGYEGYGALDFDGRFLDEDGDGVFHYRAPYLSSPAAGTYGTCMRYHPSAEHPSTWSDELYCWGWPFEDEGLYTPPDDVNPRLVSVGWNHACTIGFDKILHCWGANNDGKATPPAIGAQCLSLTYTPPTL